MLVSVVIPTWNRRAFVREAVASVLAQRDASFELVVIDDGSTDGTAGALRREFGDVLTVLSTTNRGVSAARNLGVAHSSGDWIAFLDSDDLWAPTKLAAQRTFIEANPQTEICQTQEIWLRDGRRVNPCGHHRKLDGDIFLPSLRLCLVSPSAVLLRRDLFEVAGGFDEELPACEDYDLWLRIARTMPVRLVDDPLVTRRAGHEDQLSRQHWGMDRFRVAALSRLLREGGLSAEQENGVRSVLREKCAILANGAARRGREAEARDYRVLAADPERDVRVVIG